MGHHTEDPTTTADSSDAYRRSEDGRFLPGCQGGPGRQGRFSLVAAGVATFVLTGDPGA